jgi:hypothetical protein
MQALGFNWSDVTVTQLHSVQNVYSLMSEEIDQRGAMRWVGVTCRLNRQPVVGLEYEMDCHSVYYEWVLDVKKHR